MSPHCLCIIWQIKNQIVNLVFKHPPNKVLFTHDQIWSPSHTHTSSLLSYIKPQLFPEHIAHFLSSDFNFIVHLGRPFPFLLFHYANEISFKGHSSWKGLLVRMNSPSAFLWYFRVDLFFLRHLTFQSEKSTTPVLLPGKSHGRRGVVGCSPWGR